MNATQLKSWMRKQALTLTRVKRGRVEVGEFWLPDGQSRSFNKLVATGDLDDRYSLDRMKLPLDPIYELDLYVTEVRGRGDNEETELIDNVHVFVVDGEVAGIANNGPQVAQLHAQFAALLARRR